VITGPGEYEIGGVFITGVRMSTGKKDKKGAEVPNVLFVIDYEGVTVAHLGDLTTVPSQSQIEEFGTVNVALVPVGGGNALSPAKAAEVISLIEPSIVVPMHFKTYTKGPDLDTEAGFLKEMGISEIEALPSLKVTKSSLTEETQVILLEATGA
jgi:L-ascorbate metabolism protein UlaG (beta-lactamase superfamily)